MSPSDITQLVRDLVRLPTETEWCEFKHNNENPEEIGMNLSGIANSAALLGRSRGYLVWGVEDSTHAIIGTAFKPRQSRVGNEELENWLMRLLEPRVDFRIHEADIDGTHVVVFEVPPAPGRPVRFRGNDYIRLGSYTKPLRDFPEKERALWRVFDKALFEEGVARESVSRDEVMSLLDWGKYYSLTGQPQPSDSNSVMRQLTAEGIVRPSGSQRYDVTDMGAILFASKLSEFGRLARKAVRVIVYKSCDKLAPVREQAGTIGYAQGFGRVVRFINNQLPQNEQVGQAFRTIVKVYPEIAIRELVANALIHQDFSVAGAGPMIEIFSDRTEITNPGTPLIDTLRFIDEPPRSRNEVLAALMRRMAMCEERGSGIDKVISSVEMFQLPAPDFRVAGGSTVAVLYGPRKLCQMNREERIRACYQHACLQYVSGKRMSNASLRKRLGISDKNYPLASRVIKDTIDASLVRAYREGGVSKRDATYLPFWA